MNDNIRSIGPHLRMMMPHLTPRERQVLQHLLNTGPAVRDLTIGEIAEKTQVSEAMVVKLSKKLGYSGYRDLKEMLYQYSLLPVTEMYQEIDLDDSPDVIVTKVFKTSIQALEETLAILDMAHFNRAVDTILNARQRDFYGVGGSATIAKDACHKFLRIGLRSSAYDDSHLMMMSASLLTSEDMVLAVSHSGQTSAILEAVRLARRNGATVIALTNYSRSALAREADVVLCSTARGSPLMGENAAARIAQLNIIDALFVCVAQRDYLRAEQNLEKTMSSVQQKRESER